MKPGERLQKIKQCLAAAFSPSHCEVMDEGDQHIGHPGAREGKGYFAIDIVADCFKDKSPVACHRMIYAALQDLMLTDIHALRIHVHPLK